MRLCLNDAAGVIAGFAVFVVAMVVSACSTNCRTVTKCYPREGLPDVCAEERICN